MDAVPPAAVRPASIERRFSEKQYSAVEAAAAGEVYTLLRRTAAAYRIAATLRRSRAVVIRLPPPSPPPRPRERGTGTRGL